MTPTDMAKQSHGTDRKISALKVVVVVGVAQGQIIRQQSLQRQQRAPPLRSSLRLHYLRLPRQKNQVCRVIYLPPLPLQQLRRRMI